MKRKILALACGMGISGHAVAFEFVQDNMSIVYLVGMLSQAESMYKTATQALDTAKNTLNIATNTFKSLTGSYGWGNFLNSAQAEAQRNWSPKTWVDAAEGQGGSADYQQLRSAYLKSHAYLAVDDYNKAVSNKLSQANYKQATETTASAYAQNATAYNQLQERNSDLSQLSKKIESTTNMKSSTDLNTRAVVELGYIMTNMTRLMVNMNMQMNQNLQNSIASRSSSTSFLTRSNQH